jgi:hypothetical protein
VLEITFDISEKLIAIADQYNNVPEFGLFVEIGLE